MAYDKILDVPWHAYRTWAGTARFLKRELNRWTHYTLGLALIGALLAAVGQEFHVLPAFKDWTTLQKGVAFVASAAVALSAYFGKQALTQGNTSDWIKARSAAESLKAAVYLYRASAPPFDTADREKILFDRVDAIEQTVATVQSRAVAPDAKPPDLTPLTVDDYIQKRVDDQIGYYDQRSSEYQRQNDILRNTVFWLGAASAILALMSALGVVPALIGLVATLTASLSAHAQSQQYQTLIVTYQSTSRRLLELKGAWAASHKTDADAAERSDFIVKCEHALAIENSAWVGAWSPQKPAVPPVAQA